MSAAEKTNTKTGLEINVCMGCYSTYNDGYLFDKWYKVDNLDDLKAIWDKAEKYFLECIKRERPDWDKEGHITDTYCEELYLADYEIYLDGEFISLDFGEYFSSLVSWVEDEGQYLENLNNEIALLIAVQKDYSNLDLSEIDDRIVFYEVGHNANYDLGHEIAESTCMLEEMPEHLKGYFDYEAFGRDLFLGGDFSIYTVGNTNYAVDNHSL